MEKLMARTTLLLLTLLLAACQNRPLCPSASELGEQRRHCQALQQQLQKLPADQLQARGVLEDQYQAECEQMLYYRENHSSPEDCLAH